MGQIKSSVKKLAMAKLYFPVLFLLKFLILDVKSSPSSDARGDQDEAVMRSDEGGVAVMVDGDGDGDRVSTGSPQRAVIRLTFSHALNCCSFYNRAHCAHNGRKCQVSF